MNILDMTLSDGTIKEYLDSGKIVIDPIESNQIQPASVDLTLDSNFLIVDDLSGELISMKDEIRYRKIESDSIVIPPKSFILATTRERIKLPNDLVAFVEGRSSVGRMGLFIQNAGWVDPGFEGQITLELFNANQVPIRVDAGRRICQLVFSKLDKPVDKPYSGKYKGQKGTTGSRVFLDEEVKAELDAGTI
jgi:dCTP deaminase